jgi:hypothetical protein
MSLSNRVESRAEVLPRFRRSAGGARSWIERFVRFGYVVRGVLYIMPGVLALRLASGGRGGSMSVTGAIRTIGQQPFGRVLLVGVAVGLAGYSVWGLIRAVFDPMRRGRSPAGIGQRLGYAASAIAFAGLCVATVRYLSSTPRDIAEPRDWMPSVLAMPLGGWILGAIGLCWIFGAGIVQISAGWRGSFRKDLELERMGPAEERWAVRMGRIGIVARGVVFTVIGMLLVAAAVHSGSHRAGMDDALLQIVHQPFGRFLLAATAVGLIIFGFYSAMCSRWMRVRVGRDPHSSQAPSSSFG